jgi:serine/threonine-protein kinase
MVGVLGVVVVGAAYAAIKWRVHGPAAIDSIAVLPFESFGGDTANAYFAEGMADELATALGKVPGLRVAARTSSAAVSGMKLTVGQIGARLDVRAVITGTVRRAGDRMRVRAELASVATGLTMWDSTFDRGVSDVFALQDELTRTIVGAMRLTLTAASAPGTASDVRGTANLEAYDLYLRGMHFYNRRGASLSKAVEFLEQALARDPAFARAWAGLSLALSSVAVRDAAADSLGTRAEAAAQRAVMLDSTSSDAYTALGRALMEAGKLRAANAAFEKAIALDPASAVAHHQFGYFLIRSTTDYPRGLAEIRSAVQLDPLNVQANAWLAFAMILDGRPQEAVPVAQRAFDLDSMLGPPRIVLPVAAYLAGHADSARAIARRIGSYARENGYAAFVLARTGDPAGARDLIKAIEASPENYRSLTALALAHLGLGDTARSLSYFERAAQVSHRYTVVFALPILDELRGSTRFGAVLRAYGLDDRVLNSPRGGRR